MKTTLISTYLVLAILIAQNLLAQPKQPFSILFLGDILCVNEIEKFSKRFGSDYPFKKITPELLKYDFVIGNLEAPITNTMIPSSVNKAYILKYQPTLAQCLRFLRIDGVFLANNHLCDYELEGVQDTLSYLRQWNIQSTGGGLNLTSARKPIVIKYHNTEVVVFSYNDRPPDSFYATADRWGTVPLQYTILKEDIDTYKTTHNIVLISIHWGIEQTSYPQPEQIKWAHDIIDCGADGIIGHHPHWPQGIEIYKNKPIFYSLGNFVNGYYNKIEKDNIMASFHYEGHGLKKLCIIPITGKNKEIQFQPSVMTGKSAQAMITEMRNLSKRFNTSIVFENNQGIIQLPR